MLCIYRHTMWAVYQSVVQFIFGQAALTKQKYLGIQFKNMMLYSTWNKQ